jgi:hypothetical protein
MRSSGYFAAGGGMRALRHDVICQRPSFHTHTFV